MVLISTNIILAVSDWRFNIESEYILKLEKGQISGSDICPFGAGDRTRTGTLSPAVDFESTTSTIPPHRQVRS